MTFYVYRQNNSGGYFVEDENVSAHVIIEAENEAQADIKFDEIIDKKSEYTTYCPCCGKRWSGVDETYQNVEVDSAVAEQLKKHRYYDKAVLYMADGTKKKIPWLMYGMYQYLREE
ncbi:hypothetical protein [Streptococcus oralis]|uniref:DUF7296 domain-containing protein n=1 Tax=Streptococcus oralis TaxID=1303 RepID=A0AAW5WGC7_STROR|nr:hypothetical protein [Streptococcus oralis]MCY7059545.1 hypothetical protein [Streptococcus oralis]MDB6218415.1 hypothetical protein [Streptococcus oralis]